MRNRFFGDDHALVSAREFSEILSTADEAIPEKFSKLMVIVDRHSSAEEMRQLANLDSEL
jgi:hypothetical protein